MRFRFLHVFWPAAAAALLFAGRAQAQLSAVSPFSPPDSGAASTTKDPNAIEYRGMMTTPHGPLFLLYDPAKKASVWVGLNESGSPYQIRSEDAAAEKISLRVNGQDLNLALRAAKVRAAAPALGEAINGPVNMAVGPVVLHPTPEDEQRRLQAVAEQVRLRRLQREQAEAQQQQAGPH